MDADQVEQLYMNARAVGALDRHVGARLRTRRIMLQMSEVWLADALGLTFGELSAMEAGTLKIGPRRLAFIAVALDVADRYFFMDFNPTTGEGERRPGWLREVDCWFRDCVSPHEGLFLTVAKRLVGSHSAALRASRAGISVPAYIRHQTLDVPMPRQRNRPAVEITHLARLLGQLGKIGSNVNQIARRANRRELTVCDTLLNISKK